MLARLCFIIALIAGVVIAQGCKKIPDPHAPAQPTLSEQVGSKLFHDTNLSEPHGTACASCHDPDRAFGGNHGSTVGVPFGSVGGVLGLRNTPSVMYGSYAPAFSLVPDDGGLTPTGGQFLDGRVDTQADQAKLPLLSATEMNNATKDDVVAKVAASTYAGDFMTLYGADIFTVPRVDDAFNAIAKSLQDYQHSAEFHPFTSRYDDYVRGHNTLNNAQRRGMKLFFDGNKGNCSGCHAANPDSSNPAASLFTDFTYDNLGVPRNTDIPSNNALGQPDTFYDLGLGGPKRTLPGGDSSYAGAFKVPTLRNVAVKQAFMHNGYFKNLKDVVSFYVTRDTDPTHWYLSGTKFEDLPPELRGNVNTSEVPYDRHPGDAPHLTPDEIADLVAFLGALTDEQFVPLIPLPEVAN